MALTIYATSEDLATWLGVAAPGNADQLLRSAIYLVAVACNRDPYTDVVSDTDAPALRDATCAQAALWLAVGVNPDAAGLDARVATEKKIGTGDIKYDAISASAIQEAINCLGPEPTMILTSANLLWLAVPLGDPAPFLFDYGLGDPCYWPLAGRL